MNAMPIWITEFEIKPFDQAIIEEQTNIIDMPMDAPTPSFQL